MTEKLEILTMCCVCKAIRLDGVWLKEKDNPKLYQENVGKANNNKDKNGIPSISHGYCPEDYKKVMAELDDYKK
jgi:hypothetical protein